MNAPNGQKTYTEQKIERGQDINCTWALMGHLVRPEDSSDRIDELFHAYLPVVQRINKAAREREEDNAARKSHLTTIINRVKQRSGVTATGNEDYLYEQAVINLMEYLDNTSDMDASEEELLAALSLYELHRKNVTGKCAPSHQARLKHADAIHKHWSIIVEESR
jgi:hypothetical protein